MPLETIVTYSDHGKLALRLQQGLEMVCSLPGQLAALGLYLDDVSDGLEYQGVQKFIQPHLWSDVTTDRAASHLTDKSTSQSTKPPSNGGQVAGYNLARNARQAIGYSYSIWLSKDDSQVAGYGEDNHA